jgi:hypothetical protein
LNGTINETREILTKGQNTITLNDLENSNYTWYVNCTDYSNHWNVSSTWEFKVYINEFYPDITPVACSDSDGCTVSNINNSPETWEEHGTLQKGSGQANYVFINFSQPNIAAGSTIHWMYIYYDKYQDTTEGFSRLMWRNGTTNNVTICSANFNNSGIKVHDRLNCSFNSETDKQWT